MKESFFKFMLVTFVTFWATLGNSAEDDAKDLIEAITGGSIQYKLLKLISEIPVNEHDEKGISPLFTAVTLQKKYRVRSYKSWF